MLLSYPGKDATGSFPSRRVECSCEWRIHPRHSDVKFHANGCRLHAIYLHWRRDAGRNPNIGYAACHGRPHRRVHHQLLQLHREQVRFVVYTRVWRGTLSYMRSLLWFCLLRFHLDISTTTLFSEIVSWWSETKTVRVMTVLIAPPAQRPACSTSMSRTLDQHDYSLLVIAHSAHNT